MSRETSISEPTDTTPDSGPASARWLFGVALAGVFVLAVAVRLAGVRRGAGLYGLGNYDDGVHFAAALGLINGLLPYRDFLLLHPPGVVLALAPFAALSWLIGEPDAMAVARVSWMLLGGLNAVLCGLALRPIGRVAGLVGALCYALSIGAIYVEHTTLLEPPATTVLLAALVITRLLGPAGGIGTHRYVIAGLLLGLSPVLKVWGVVAVLVVVIGILARRGWRPGLITLGASLASCAAICLPFFLAAPQEMWRMVVVAQASRRRVAEPPAARLNDVLGTREWVAPGASGQWSTLLTAVATTAVLATLICLLTPGLRVVAGLMLTHLGLVLITPMWFLHYAGVTAAPLALTIGGATGVLMSWNRHRRWLAAGCALLVVAGLVVLALPLRTVVLGKRPFPAAALAPAVVDRAGCITTDWPMALIQLGLLQRDIDRGCRFVVDLGGYSYYLTDSPYHGLARGKNPDWQTLALDYYRSGDAVMPVRFNNTGGLSKSTKRVLASWPVITEADGYVIRHPQPASG